MFIFESETEIEKLVERYFSDVLHSYYVLHLLDNYKKGCQNLGFNLGNSQELAYILKWASYNYTVADYNEEVAKINERSPQAYDLLVSYKSETWPTSS